MVGRSICLMVVRLALVGAILLTSWTARAGVADDIAAEQAELVASRNDPPITSLEVEGLSRTRHIVVRQWIDACSVGQPLSKCDLPTIYERLYRLAIFSKIDVDFEEQSSGVDVVFRFQEKWTVYPVPVLWYTPGTQIAGLILVEANAFGFNKGLAAGGVYSNRGWYALGGYNDPNIGYTPLFGEVHMFLGSGIQENDTPEGDVAQLFDITRFDLEYALGWTFWDRISPVYNGGVRIARVGDVKVPGNEPITNATVGIQAFQLIYSNRRFRDLYDHGLRLSAEVQHAFALDGVSRPYDDAILDAKWAFPGPLRGFFDTHARAFIGSVPVVFEERLGGVAGSRTISGAGLVAADRDGFVTAGYHVPFLRVTPGTATIGFFGEFGQYQRNDDPVVTYGGPGTSLRFYLKKVAIPAVGVDVAYETVTGRVAVSISVGYRPLR